ncbi:arginine--tRNA ligase [Candidatus Collierbacteria bacterium RIFOXYD1_FULL_40_9]|uniref:Arginine--tRNA ligase n=1 Tax=Candidatus Collierbacteria bacterium RIFOXYD1_FULL_40_9 TaxID=1817731 RepID=A0A1F5FNZ0_9BACT|nr:MAG: arginine--tRNA ligase [Candidatus Collierbacteria bacterium RIFOXYD1_FULL_40_9]
MKVKEIIEKTIKEVFNTESFSVDRPSEESRCDFACNVAMVLSKTVGKNPRELAEEMVEKLKKDKELALVVDLEKIEVAGPGFINFWVRDEYLGKKISGVSGFRVKPGMTESEIEIGDSDWMKGKKVLVEYSSPNIAKRFSVGHLRSTIIGQALFNLYKASGASLTNDNHLGDWGTQFGMIIAAVEEENLDISKMSVGELEELYVRFNTRISDNPDLKEKAREAFLRLEQGDANARKIWQLAIDVSMKEFNEIYKKLGVSFENMYGESVYEQMMLEIIEDLKRKGIATEGERGAYIIKFEKNGKEYMPPAMLVKSDGSTTYMTRDMATIQKRLTEKKLNADLYIYEVGSEQKLHFRQVFETARMLWPNETKDVRFVHVAHGLLTLPEGKMSTRKGNTIKLEDLIAKAGDEARDFVKSEDVDAEKMAINAIKYNELRRSPELNYVFRWEEALAMEGNSAPYINYAYVRAKKIVEKLETEKTQTLKILFEGEERDLARLLMRFAEGEIVEDAAKNFAPHLVAGYLFEVAKKFNAFYDHNKVLGDSREKERLVLVNAVAEGIKKGMKLLGIEVVEKM